MYVKLERREDEIIRQHQAAAPVDVSGIARQLGIAVWESDGMKPNISGMLFRDPNHGGDAGYSILVKRAETLTRKRFTVAHEIAHFMLHREQVDQGGITDDTYYRSKLSSAQEAEANQLAEEILMPYSLINAVTQSGTRDVRELASTFLVSEPTMKARLGIPVV